MTSASSSTNIDIFFGSKRRYRMIQSNSVPGVPMITWDLDFSSFATANKMKELRSYLVNNASQKHQAKNKACFKHIRTRTQAISKMRKENEH